MLETRQKGGETLLAAFRTKFWDLLTEKEQRENTRYTSITAMAEQIGVSRVTFYKYTEEALTSVDASVVTGFMKFLDVAPDEVGRFLVIDHSPQLNGQEAQSATEQGKNPEPAR